MTTLDTCPVIIMHTLAPRVNLFLLCIKNVSRFAFCQVFPRGPTLTRFRTTKKVGDENCQAREEVARFTSFFYKKPLQTVCPHTGILMPQLRLKSFIFEFSKTKSEDTSVTLQRFITLGPDTGYGWADYLKSRNSQNVSYGESFFFFFCIIKLKYALGNKAATTELHVCHLWHGS